jgi:hypothetical protein
MVLPIQAQEPPQPTVLSAQAFELQPNFGLTRVRVVVQCSIIVARPLAALRQAATGVTPKEWRCRQTTWK